MKRYKKKYNFLICFTFSKIDGSTGSGSESIKSDKHFINKYYLDKIINTIIKDRDYDIICISNIIKL